MVKSNTVGFLAQQTLNSLSQKAPPNMQTYYLLLLLNYMGVL